MNSGKFNFRLPPDAVRLLCFQQSGYQSLIGLAYREDCNRWASIIIAGCESTPRRILDIGCGLAGVDVFLGNHWPDAEIWLADKACDGKKRVADYGDMNDFAGYNDLKESRRLLQRNGVKSSNIHTWNVAQNGMRLPSGNFDLIISLKSWCFHYCSGTYEEQVREQLTDNGTLMLDVRLGCPRPFAGGTVAWSGCGAKHEFVKYVGRDIK